jgi:DNA-binding transcriptional MerR regulator
MTMTFSIQRASAETGLSPDTLRYYERIGVLPGVARSPNGHRRYAEGDIGWIKLVQCLRATGMPIEDLHQYATLMQEGDGTAAQRLQLLEAHRTRITEEMRELTTALELVNRKIDGYDQILRRAQIESPPTHRPGPRKVRIRPAG